MIKLEKLTPNVYYQQSRDFQLIGRLYDLVLNSAKTNSDLVYNFPLNDDTDTRFIDLMAMTLGFKLKHEYNIIQLYALCKVFPTILKNKGNIEAVRLAGMALINSEGITSGFECYMSDNTLNVYIPQALSDISLFNDLLNYILPAGITCRVIRASIAASADDRTTILRTKDTITTTLVSEQDSSAIVRPDADDVSETNSSGIYINSTVNQGDE